MNNAVATVNQPEVSDINHGSPKGWYHDPWAIVGDRNGTARINLRHRRAPYFFKIYGYNSDGSIDKTRIVHSTIAFGPNELNRGMYNTYRRAALIANKKKTSQTETTMNNIQLSSNELNASVTNTKRRRASIVDANAETVRPDKIIDLTLSPSELPQATVLKFENKKL